jgi:hypothetical protein
LRRISFTRIYLGIHRRVFRQFDFHLARHHLNCADRTHRITQRNQLLWPEEKKALSE